MFEYLTDGNEIYRQSFALIRAEADLGAFTPDQAQVAVRMIHAAGQTDLARDIEFSPHLVTAARMALAAGKPILTDVFMVHSGITRTRLPHNNEALCFLRDDRVPGLAKQLGTTRTAAAVELWEPHLDGAVVAIGNAPTALFHLLNWLLADPASPWDSLGRRNRNKHSLPPPRRSAPNSLPSTGVEAARPSPAPPSTPSPPKKRS